jgi:predicted HTH domain antitoxin
MSQSFTVEYPDRLPDALNMSPGEFEREARMALAAKLYELGRLSSDEAARMAGLDRVRFLLALERFGVSVINLDEEELKQEFAHAREAFAGRQ